MVKRLLLNARESGGFWLPGGIVVEDVGVDPVVSVGVVPGWGVERGVDEDVAVGVGVGVPGVGDGVGVIAVLVGGGGDVGDGGSVQVQVTETGVTRPPFAAVPVNTRVSLAGQGRFEIVTVTPGGTVPPCGVNAAEPEACQFML